MINSAGEFQRLRTSEDLEEQRRATWEPAEHSVWIEIIERFPDLRAWVAHNKTVPLSVLRALAADSDAMVRAEVARRRKLDRELFELLAQDPDPGVRCSVASNRKAPADIITKLASDPEAFVAKTATERTGR
jgi:hypothetical protein